MLRQSPLLYQFFMSRPTPPPPPPLHKNQIFKGAPKILKLFILNPTLSVKSNKIFSLNFQFEFLVVTEKNIKKRLSTFLSLNIQILFYFYGKIIAIPLKKKSTLSFSANPLKKFGSCQDPALFFKIPYKVRKAESRVQTIWGVPVPSFLISFCIKAGMHMCWSLSLITFQALKLQYFSLQFSSLHT